LRQKSTKKAARKMLVKLTEERQLVTKFKIGGDNIHHL
jgi:hypothetical protein